jgi:hypothetical protein
MRRLLSILTIASVVTGLVALPVVARPAPHPHPVAPQLARLTLTPAAAGHGRAIAAGRLRATSFSLVGATWRAGAYDASRTRVQVRVRTDAGWSGWQDLRPDDAGADGAGADARGQGSVASAAPMWTGPATGLDARVVPTHGSARPPLLHPAAPVDLTVDAIDPGTSQADADPQPAAVVGAAVAAAATSEPDIYTRADWGADESLRENACHRVHYARTLKVAFVHHTDSGNGYSAGEVPAIIRGIYAYHVLANHWCDIGYNFLVDRFGRVWEGRYGGITRAVIGAHAGAFNTESSGVALIGTFTSARPSPAMLHALEHLIAWKLAANYRDPLGHETLTAGTFSASRYPKGSHDAFATISGHRDADLTSCPGSAAYSRLPAVRRAVRARMGAGFVDPRLSARRAVMGLQHVVLHADVIAGQSWQLQIERGGTTVRTITGRATRSDPVAVSWNLTDDHGLFVAPGSYRLRLTGANTAGTALPWSRPVVVVPPVTVHAATSDPLAAMVSGSGRGRPGDQVVVDATDLAGTRRVGAFPVGPAGNWSGSLGALADDTTWSAHDPAIPAYTARAVTRVHPVVTGPADQFGARGQPVPLAGTARPGATVTLMTEPVAGTAAQAGPTAPVDSAGAWSASVTPTVPLRVWAVDARGLRSAAVTAYPVDPPTATAPTSGYAGRSVDVTGNAGGAPVGVKLATLGANNVWTTVRTSTAAADGTFDLRLPLPTAAGSSVTWRVTTALGSTPAAQVSVLATPPPTIGGPAEVGWNTLHALYGTAVPGDRVVVHLKPPSSTIWVAVGQTNAGSDGTWRLAVRFRHDTDWNAESPSGTSTDGRTNIVPTIHATPSGVAGDPVKLSGTAIPGGSLTVLRAATGSSTWTVVQTVTVGSGGAWAATVRPQTSSDYRAVLRHSSRVVTVTVT